MADDKVLSMSLDEIIKLKRTGESSENQPKFRNQQIGARGKNASYRVKPGRSRTALIRAPIRKTAPKLQTPFTNPRGIIRRRGLHNARGGQFTRNWNLNVNRLRQYNIALGRSRLQVAKRFLNQRQRGGARRMAVPTNFIQQRKMWQGVGQRFRRGRGGVHLSGLAPNTFRSDQLVRLSRLNTFQNKVNRRLSSRRNQVPTGPSLIVSIENERAGPSITNNLRRMNRRRGGAVGNGSWNRQQSAAQFGRVPVQNYQQPNPMPYHTGALDPEIQLVIADIQGKRKPNNMGPTNSNLRRGSGVRRGVGVGRMQRFGRTQLTRGHDVNFGRFNPGLPLGITVNTLNERFGGMR